MSVCRAWSEGDPILEKYHDHEWCKINHDDDFEFEMLCLEGASVGLSWQIIMHKREAYRAAFHAEEKTVEAEIQKRQLCGRRIETLVAALETAGEDFTVSLWGSMVEKVTVFKDALVFTLTSGEDIRVAPC